MWNWHTRKQAMIFTQCFTYNNIFSLAKNSKWIDLILEIISRLLKDEVIEVRESARQTLSSVIIWDIIDSEKMGTLINYFKRESSQSVKRIDGKDGHRFFDPSDVGIRHGGILGLCAFVYAYPDDLPNHLPDIIIFLTEHFSDPQPIPVREFPSLLSLW